MKNSELTFEEKEKLKEDINKAYANAILAFSTNTKKKDITVSFMEERKEVKRK